MISLRSWKCLPGDTLAVNLKISNCGEDEDDLSRFFLPIYTLATSAASYMSIHLFLPFPIKAQRSKWWPGPDHASEIEHLADICICDLRWLRSYCPFAELSWLRYYCWISNPMELAVLDSDEQIGFCPVHQFLVEAVGLARSLNKLLSEWDKPVGWMGRRVNGSEIRNEPPYVNVSFVENLVVRKLILITSIKIITRTSLLAPTSNPPRACGDREKWQKYKVHGPH